MGPKNLLGLIYVLVVELFKTLKDVALQMTYFTGKRVQLVIECLSNFILHRHCRV